MTWLFSSTQHEEERSPPSPIIFSSKSCDKMEDDSEVFSRHIAHELRQMPQRQRKLAKLKIKQVCCFANDFVVFILYVLWLNNVHNGILSLQVISEFQSSRGNIKQNRHFQEFPHVAEISFKKNSCKSKKLRQHSRERRRRRKKSLEYALERTCGFLDSNAGTGISGTSENQFSKVRNKIKKSTVRLVGQARCSGEKNEIHSRDQSPTPPRTICSVVQTAKTGLFWVIFYLWCQVFVTSSSLQFFVQMVC